MPCLFVCAPVCPCVLLCAPVSPVCVCARSPVWHAVDGGCAFVSRLPEGSRASFFLTKAAYEEEGHRGAARWQRETVSHTGTHEVDT